MNKTKTQRQAPFALTRQAGPWQRAVGVVAAEAEMEAALDTAVVVELELELELQQQEDDVRS
jgi:hypothetical protein